MPLLGLASLDRMHADTASRLRPVDVRGTLVPPTRVPVLLTDPAMTTPYVSGFATVIPVRDALVSK